MTTHAELAARLLREAAGIYRTLAQGKDEELNGRLTEFSTIYERVAELVEADPTGVIERVSDS